MQHNVNMVEEQGCLAKLSIYLQLLPDMQHFFSCKIMRENEEIKD